MSWCGGGGPMSIESRLTAPSPMEINTVSHESWVHTHGCTVLVIYTSEMHSIRYFWLLGGVLVPPVLSQLRTWMCGVSFSVVSVFAHIQNTPSRPDGWRAAGMALSLTSGYMSTLIATAGIVPAHWAWHPGPRESYQTAADPPLFSRTALYRWFIICGVNKLNRVHVCLIFFSNVWRKKREGYNNLLFAPAAFGNECEFVLAVQRFDHTLTTAKCKYP